MTPKPLDRAEKVRGVLRTMLQHESDAGKRDNLLLCMEELGFLTGYLAFLESVENNQPVKRIKRAKNEPQR